VETNRATLEQKTKAKMEGSQVSATRQVTMGQIEKKKDWRPWMGAPVLAECVQWGTPPTAPLSPRPQGWREKGKGLVGHTQSGPPLLPAQRKPPATRERKKMTFPKIAEAKRLAWEWKPRDK